MVTVMAGMWVYLLAWKKNHKGHLLVGVVALSRLGQHEAQQLRGSLTAGAGAELVVAEDAARPRS